MIVDNIANIIGNNSKDNEYIINNQKYIFNLVFLNPDNSLLTLSKNNVKNLTIQDNAFFPFNKLTISFVDDGNAFERLQTNKQETEFSPELDVLKGYRFRGDGRDYFYVEIIPIENVNNPYGVQEEDYNSIFGFRNLYICADTNENIEDGKVIKTINLIDFDEKMLKERKSFFSSSNLINDSDKPIQFLSNNEREVETGKCIKNLLNDTLLTKNLDQIVETDENGETPEFEDGLSKIYYTSPSDNNAFEDLIYLHGKHVSNSSSKDFSFFKKQNYTNKYTLKSVKDAFDKAYNKGDGTAGFSNYEKLIITGTSDSTSVIENTKKTPISIPSFGEYSEIKNIKFFNTDSLLNSETLVTNVLHSYDFNNKQFNVDKQDSDITNVRDKFDEYYVKNMKGNRNKPFVNLTLNQTKSTNLSFKNLYSLYGENENIKLGENLNKLLKNSLVTNLAAEITLKGQMFRKTTKFISIDREGEYVDNLFDDKFLGIYLIVNLEHIFTNDTGYNNRILAIKTYIFDDPKFNEDVL